MTQLYREPDFKLEEYEEFYKHHHFSSIDDEHSVNAHRLFPRVRWAMRVAREIEPKKVLDLGCLEGYALLTLAKHLPIEYGLGVDLSEDGIAMAQRRAEKYELDNLDFKLGLVEYVLSRLNTKFDLIMAFELIEHVKDPVLLLDLIDRVSNPGANVLISTPDFESPRYGKDDERNKCHLRLYTTAHEDYEAENKFGNIRKATSLSKQLGKKRKLISMDVKSELIHARYTV